MVVTNQKNVKQEALIRKSFESELWSVHIRKIMSLHEVKYDLANNCLGVPCGSPMVGWTLGRLVQSAKSCLKKNQTNLSIKNVWRHYPRISNKELN